MKFWTLSLLMVFQPLLAEETTQHIPAVDPVSSTYLIKITLGLAFILLLIFVLAWVMKKMQLTPQSGQQMIKIVSAISVGTRDRIALVEVGDEQILVGLTPGRIQKLHTMSSPVQQANGVSVQSHGFSERFSRLMKRGDNLHGSMGRDQSHDS